MDGRGVAIVLIALVSGASFALGFYVGKTTTDTIKEIRIVSVPPGPETLKEEAPVEAGAEKPAVAAKEAKVEKSPAAPVKTADKPVAVKPPKRKVARVYSVQIGAFKNRKDAEALQQQFKGKGYSAYLLRTKTREENPVYKVRIGKFRKKKDAEILSLKFKKIEGMAAFITRN